MVKLTRRMTAAAAALLALGLTVDAAAQDTVKIGAVYPLSGNAASAGNYEKMAIELAAEVVNNGNAELAKILPFISATGGLPGLKGAKIQVVVADNQGTPAAGANQTLRLITQEKVAAIIGSYQSGITETTSATAEKYGIPFVNPESVAANLTERGFKWFFRVTPVAADFAKAYSAFLKEQKVAGKKVDSIAIIHENTEYGNSVSKVIADVFKTDGLNVTQNISYSANSTDVQPQVLQLKEKNPDVAIFISYTSDAILYTKTMKEQNWKPSILIADDAGFNDPKYIKEMGSQVEGLISRTSFSAGKPGSVPTIFDALYRKKTGGDGLEDVSGRGLQGMLVLLDAINRAGSTEAEPIRAALAATDLTAEQLIMPWSGVKFDATGQNTLGRGILVQIVGGKYNTVYPFNLATREVIWPMPKWNERK